MAVHTSIYESPAYWYWVDNPDNIWRDVQTKLDAGERQVLLDVVRQFGQLPLRSLVNVSKNTKPFSKAVQYDVLQFEENEQAFKMRASLHVSNRFLEEVNEALRDAEVEEWIWEEGETVTSSS